MTSGPPAAVPALDREHCERLREAFRRSGYDLDGVPALLGEQAHAALGRDEPVPARLASRDAGPLGTLVRLLLLGDAEPADAVARALDPLPVDDAVAAGLLRPDPAGAGLLAALDVRPYGDDAGSWWVVSDLDAARLGGQRVALAADHVLGVGQASLSLAVATVRRPVRRLLDVGTGCGVQALHAARYADRVVATDVNPRALALARATFALSEVDIELRAGSWLEPVAGERFDQIVCNPPFVAGPPRVSHVYRDSGLAGDGVAARLVGELPGLLAEDGVAQLLACWLHVRGQDWPDRVLSWLPAEVGLDAWFVQREVADPALYVGTWLRDSGVDPGSPEGQREAAEWLAWFAEVEVEGVGFGFVTLRRAPAGSALTVLCEDLRDAPAGPLGPETGGWLDRVAWLRAHGTDEALLAAALTVAPSVLLERSSVAGEDGWREVLATVRRTDGPGWRHELDEPAAALLAGCQGFLPLGELLALLAVAHGRDTDELVAATLPAVRELVRHGLLVPAGWTDGSGGAPTSGGAPALAGGPAVGGAPAVGGGPASGGGLAVGR
ncbi:MAG TPA: methyltransferase [Pseudonocardia sp.]